MKKRIPDDDIGTVSMVRGLTATAKKNIKMANTYTQLYIQIVFAVSNRRCLVLEKNREELQKYLCGIVNEKKSKPLAVYCNPDHVHILIGLHPATSISDMARDLKANSSKWINNKAWMKTPFKWQTGFGAFSYSRD